MVVDSSSADSWFFIFSLVFQLLLQRKIKAGILYGSSGLNKPAVDGALAARFQEGSNTVELESFVTKLEGKREKIETAFAENLGSGEKRSEDF